MNGAYADGIQLAIALLLVAVNGFFVAAEFALIRIRPGRVDELVRQGRPFARSVRWLSERLDSSLAACQLGITMASLALGWVGEPAFARLLEPVFRWFGIESQAALHGLAFAIAFTLITALHLVIGEQAPKIFAIRRPEVLALWCAVPLRMFYVATYPLLALLSSTTARLLRRFGVDDANEHETPHTEDEIRQLLSQSRMHGELTASEHRLMNAVLAFDDMLCRRVMLPRADVEFFDVSQPFAACLELAKRTQHTRYPVCENSLDAVVGVVHIKDLVGAAADTDLRGLMRPPRYVPEAMPISKLLRHFQASRQHMAFVLDEHGTVTGIVTLENVLEQIVGPVEDEFDSEDPDIVPEGDGVFLVRGGASIDLVKRKLELSLADTDADTLSGYLTARLGRLVAVGDEIQLDDAVAYVLEVKGARAERVRITRTTPAEGT